MISIVTVIGDAAVEAEGLLPLRGATGRSI